jgi:hypothetical protein
MNMQQAHEHADEHTQTCNDPNCQTCNPGVYDSILLSQLIEQLQAITPLCVVCNMPNHDDLEPELKHDFDPAGDPLVTVYVEDWYRHIESVTVPDQMSGPWTVVLRLGRSFDPREI